jgi:hypothetical protein
VIVPPSLHFGSSRQVQARRLWSRRVRPGRPSFRFSGSALAVPSSTRIHPRLGASPLHVVLLRLVPRALSKNLASEF